MLIQIVHRIVRPTTSIPFDYSSKVSSGAVPRAAHATMDPKAVAGAKSPFVGNVMRESRDSDGHPDSLAIGVIFDITGSMGQIPIVLQTKLAGLMQLLIAKGYAPHPQILFGAIGDASPPSPNTVPLQIGQFESDITMDDNLTNIFLEGMGGSQHHETYELAHYFFARHTSTDCFEKRGHKGYFFTIGDEAFYPTVKRAFVKQYIGDDNLEGDLTTESVVQELEEKYHVFHIHAQQGSYRNDPKVLDPWKALLGERLLLLEDANDVAETIALTIGINEGTTDIDAGERDLVAVGASASTVRSVKDALIPFAAKTGMLKNAVVNLPSLSGKGSTGGITRL